MYKFYKEYLVKDEKVIEKITELDEHDVIKSLKPKSLLVSLDNLECTARVDVNEDFYMLLDYSKMAEILNV